MPIISHNVSFFYIHFMQTMHCCYLQNSVYTWRLVRCWKYRHWCELDAIEHQNEWHKGGLPNKWVDSHCNNRFESMETAAVMQLETINCHIWTHWGLSKMATVEHMIFSNGFYEKNNFAFYYLNLLLRVQLIMSQHWFRQWLCWLKCTEWMNG